MHEVKVRLTWKYTILQTGSQCSSYLCHFLLGNGKVYFQNTESFQSLSMPQSSHLLPSPLVSQSERHSVFPSKIIQTADSKPASQNCWLHYISVLKNGKEVCSLFLPISVFNKPQTSRLSVEV
jgi:hypothetical protein